MKYLARTEIHPALRPFVRSVWYFEGPDLPHARERVLPDGAMQLLVNLHEDELRWWDADDVLRRTRGAAVSGAYPGAIVIDTAEQRRITGVSFAPGGATPLLAVPSSELSRDHPALDDVWRGEPVRERMQEAASPRAVLDVWEDVLLDRLRGGLDRRVAFAIDAFEHGTAVREVARELGWSGKRLRRRFSERVGLAPKRFARIRRLQRVLREVGERAPRPWAQIAVACGFHDQAHLIRDFRELAGMTPTAYRPRASDDQNHVVVD